MFDRTKGDIYSCGPMQNGKWYVRPIDWTGGWDLKTMTLISGNVLHEVDTREEAEEIANRMNEEARKNV